MLLFLILFRVGSLSGLYKGLIFLTKFHVIPAQTENTSGLVERSFVAPTQIKNGFELVKHAIIMPPSHKKYLLPAGSLPFSSLRLVFPWIK